MVLVCAEDPGPGLDTDGSFTTWYTGVRRPEIQRAGPYLGGSLFARAIPATSAGPVAFPQPYLGIYGATGPVARERGERARTALLAHADRTTAVALDEYELIADLDGVDGGATAGILMVLTDNLDPDRDDDFNQWYDVTHVADIVATGAYSRVRRYRRPGPVDDGPRFISLYETFWDNPLAAHALVQAKAPTMELWPAIRAHQVANYRVLEPALPGQ